MRGDVSKEPESLDCIGYLCSLMFQGGTTCPSLNEDSFVQMESWSNNL